MLSLGILFYRNEIASRFLWRRIEAETMISWLSTLGGGFSALGESYERYVSTITTGQLLSLFGLTNRLNFPFQTKIAGKISIRQLQIGMEIEDPVFQVRCKLYYVISLIQTGQLSLAEMILRRQFTFAKMFEQFDHRLIKMCHGIWVKLLHAKEERQKNGLEEQMKISWSGQSGAEGGPKFQQHHEVVGKRAS